MFTPGRGRPVQATIRCAINSLPTGREDTRSGGNERQVHCGPTPDGTRSPEALEVVISRDN